MRKKPKEPIFGCLLSSFTKSNQRKPTHCGEEIIKQGKPVCRLESIKELLEEEVVNCTTSLEREELNKWSHDQDKNEGEIQQTGGQKAASCQGNSCSLADDMLNYFFEMMHTSPDLFSQSLCRAKGVCPDTPYSYSTPRLLKVESHSWCSKHFSGTLDLFSSPNCSPSRQEMNSVSLFTCSNHSLLSFSSSPLRLVEKPVSSSGSNRNEPDAS